MKVSNETFIRVKHFENFTTHCYNKIDILYVNFTSTDI